MVIHASNQFSKWFRCRISLRGRPVEQGRLFDHWSADIVQLRTKRLALMMNDASLWSIIVSTEKAYGAKFDPGNQSLYFLKRSNRSLIGSMNEAIYQIHAAWQNQGPTLSWQSMEAYLNEMPYGALNYDSPHRVMRRMLEALA